MFCSLNALEVHAQGKHLHDVANIPANFPVLKGGRLVVAITELHGSEYGCVIWSATHWNAIMRYRAKKVLVVLDIYSMKMEDVSKLAVASVLQPD